jgi:hypothetical protein
MDVLSKSKPYKQRAHKVGLIGGHDDVYPSKLIVLDSRSLSQTDTIARLIGNPFSIVQYMRHTPTSLYPHVAGDQRIHRRGSSDRVDEYRRSLLKSSWV